MRLLALSSWPATNILNHFLSPERDGTSSAGGVSRRFCGESTGGECDVCHCTKHHRAATGQSLMEVAARLNLVVRGAFYSPPALSLLEPAAHAAGMGLPSLSGLRKWSNVLLWIELSFRKGMGCALVDCWIVGILVGRDRW